jgi:hypothetical protein
MRVILDPHGPLIDNNRDEQAVDTPSDFLRLPLGGADPAHCIDVKVMDGRIELRSNLGSLVIRPVVSNSVIVELEV